MRHDWARGLRPLGLPTLSHFHQPQFAGKHPTAGRCQRRIETAWFRRASTPYRVNATATLIRGRFCARTA